MERQESHSFSSVGRSPRFLCRQRQAQLEQESPPPRPLPRESPPPRPLPRESPPPRPLPRESPPPRPLPRESPPPLPLPRESPPPRLLPWMTCTSLPELHVTKLYRPHQRKGSAGMGKAVRLPELVVAKPRALPRAAKPAAAPWWEGPQRPDLLHASRPLLRSDAPPPGARAGLQWGRAGDPVRLASLAISSSEPVWGSRGGEDSGWCELTADCRPEGHAENHCSVAGLATGHATWLPGLSQHSHPYHHHEQERPAHPLRTTRTGSTVDPDSSSSGYNTLTEASTLSTLTESCTLSSAAVEDTHFFLTGTSSEMSLCSYLDSPAPSDPEPQLPSPRRSISLPAINIGEFFQVPKAVVKRYDALRRLAVAARIAANRIAGSDVLAELQAARLKRRYTSTELAALLVISTLGPTELVRDLLRQGGPSLRSPAPKLSGLIHQTLLTHAPHLAHVDLNATCLRYLLQPLGRRDGTRVARNGLPRPPRPRPHAGRVLSHGPLPSNADPARKPSRTRKAFGRTGPQRGGGADMWLKGEGRLYTADQPVMYSDRRPMFPPSASSQPPQLHAGGAAQITITQPVGHRSPPDTLPPVPQEAGEGLHAANVPSVPQEAGEELHAASVPSVVRNTADPQKWKRKMVTENDSSRRDLNESLHPAPHPSSSPKQAARQSQLPTKSRREKQSSSRKCKMGHLPHTREGDDGSVGGAVGESLLQSQGVSSEDISSGSDCDSGHCSVDDGNYCELSTGGTEEMENVNPSASTKEVSGQSSLATIPDSGSVLKPSPGLELKRQPSHGRSASISYPLSSGKPAKAPVRRSSLQPSRVKVKIKKGTFPIARAKRSTRAPPTSKVAARLSRRTVTRPRPSPPGTPAIQRAMMREIGEALGLVRHIKESVGVALEVSQPSSVSLLEGGGSQGSGCGSLPRTGGQSSAKSRGSGSVSPCGSTHAQPIIRMEDERSQKRVGLLVKKKRRRQQLEQQLSDGLQRERAEVLARRQTEAEARRYAEELEREGLRVQEELSRHAALQATQERERQTRLRLDREIRQDWQLYGQAMLEQRLREVAVWDEWDFAYLRHCLSSGYAARVRAREEEGRERERATGELRLLQTIQVQQQGLLQTLEGARKRELQRHNASAVDREITQRLQMSRAFVYSYFKLLS